MDKHLPNFSALSALKERFPNQFSDNPDILNRHGKGESWHPSMPPQLVLYPECNEDVQAAMQICATHLCPVIPYGTGTSLEGHLAALQGGVSLDLSGMNKVLAIHQSDLDCTVEAGVTRKQLNQALKDQGLFFPIDPGADASLGGMAATRASGTNAVRYGTMRELVLGAKVVTADGRLIKTGGRARKSASGYDLTRLFVGSEGTLGIMTELTLRLFALPQVISAAVVQFEQLNQAVECVIAVMQSAIPVARVELLDQLQMQASIAYSNLDEFTPAPTLFFEFHGSEQSTDHDIAEVQELASYFGGSGFQWANHPEERTRLWTARHNAYYAALSLKPNCSGLVTDICVPISELSKMIEAATGLLKDYAITAPLVGHVGDGNFHLCMLVDAEDSDSIERAEQVAKQLARLAIDAGGTATGEHGIGYGKIGLMDYEHGSDAVAMMQQLKAAFDPNHLLNPGKILP